MTVGMESSSQQANVNVPHVVPGGNICQSAEESCRRQQQENVCCGQEAAWCKARSKSSTLNIATMSLAMLLLMIGYLTVTPSSAVSLQQALPSGPVPPGSGRNITLQFQNCDELRAARRFIASNFPGSAAISGFFNLSCTERSSTSSLQPQTPAVMYQSTAPPPVAIATTELTEQTARPATPSRIRGYSCHILQSPAERILESITGGGNLVVHHYECGRVGNAPGQGDIASQMCHAGQHCYASEHEEILVRHRHGIEQIMNVSGCSCRNERSACHRYPLIHRYNFGSPLEVEVDIGTCHGSCSELGYRCQASREVSISIPSPQGDRCVKNITECSCAGSCVFKKHTEVYSELKKNESSNTWYTVDRHIETGTCVGSCAPSHQHSSYRPKCAPDFEAREDWFIGGHRQLMKIGVVTGCLCV